MKRVSITRLGELLVFAGLCLLIGLMGTGRLAAKNGRDFAGLYHVTDVTDEGDNYSFTFKARVMNYSGNAITDGILILRSSDLPRKDYAVFSGVNMADRRPATVSGPATVPKPEYERWQRGASPVLIIQYKDADGNSQEKRVELAPRPIE